MPKIFAPKPKVPWQPGGLTDPKAPQPDPAKGQYITEYQDAAGKTVRTVADWTDSETTPDGLEIAWEKVIRFVAVADVP